MGRALRRECRDANPLSVSMSARISRGERRLATYKWLPVPDVTLVGAENQDRVALYREIAHANGHPDWEGDIRAKFGERWVAKAQAGWWVQDTTGAWRKK